MLVKAVGSPCSLSRYIFMEGRKQLIPAVHAMTNGLGEYRMFGVAAGKYYLSAQGRMNMEWSAVDRSAAPEPDQDYVVTYYPGTNVLVRKGDAEAFPGFDRNMASWRGPDGIFELRGIRPGSYIVRASYIEPPNQQQSGSVPVEVTDADVEGVVVHLTPGAEVTGTVRLEGDGQLPSGDLTVYLESRTSR